MKKLIKNTKNRFNDVNAFKDWADGCACARCICSCNNNETTRSSKKLSAVQHPTYHSSAA